MTYHERPINFLHNLFQIYCCIISSESDHSKQIHCQFNLFYSLIMFELLSRTFQILTFSLNRFEHEILEAIKLKKNSIIYHITKKRTINWHKINWRNRFCQSMKSITVTHYIQQTYCNFHIYWERKSGYFDISMKKWNTSSYLSKSVEKTFQIVQIRSSINLICCDLIYFQHTSNRCLFSFFK